MLGISGIDAEKVRRWGKAFQKLAADAHRNYEEMITQEHRPQDPNRQEVVMISDDEDEEFDNRAGSPDDDSVNFDLDAEPQGTRSSYFQHRPEVENLNARSK